MKCQKKSEFDEALNVLFDNEVLSQNVEEKELKILSKEWCEKNPINQNAWNLEEPVAQKKLFHLTHVHKPNMINCVMLETEKLCKPLEVMTVEQWTIVSFQLGGDSEG